MIIHGNTDLKLKDIIDELLLVLSDKEKMVIVKRFSLDNKPRQTLENIGRSFAVTRERIRQIEVTAIKKLQRNAINSKIKRVSSSISSIIKNHSYVCDEKQIIIEALAMLHEDQKSLNGHIIRLALEITPDIERSDSPRSFSRFWYNKKYISMLDIKSISKVVYIILKKKSDIVNISDLIEETTLQIDDSELDHNVVLETIKVDKRFILMDNNHCGLHEWRHINPKSIHDKALIVLRENRKPMHFVDIANAIVNKGFNNKVVTIQAVHNDLIRYPKFVLVGRGMYALKEWGYTPGTVADVIADILKKNGPTSKKDIVKLVQEQRDVKVGTISLNLQKEDAFFRVGRAVYDFNENLWNPNPAGRGRKQGFMEGN